MSQKIVEPREQAHLGELAHPGEQGELHVRVAGLDRRVQPAQVVRGWRGPLPASPARPGSALSYSSTSTTTRSPVRSCSASIRSPKTLRRGSVAGSEVRPSLDAVELGRRVRVQVVRLLVVSAAEVESQHRAALRPVPIVVDGEAPEQRLVALEQLPDGVHQQALAEAPRAGEEVVRPLVHQPPDERRLVDVVMALPPGSCGRSWMPMGQLASGRRPPPRRRGPVPCASSAPLPARSPPIIGPPAAPAPHRSSAAPGSASSEPPVGGRKPLQEAGAAPFHAGAA